MREHQGVYSVGHAQSSPAALADAAVLACGPRAALSHDSAAALWGLRQWPPVPEISSALQHKRPGIRSHRTTTLTLADITIRRGSASPRPPRTIADIAPRLTDDQLTRLIHEARRNRDLPNAELARLSQLCPRAAGVYDSEEPPSRSVFQHAFKAFLIGWDLPIPEFEVALARLSRSTRSTGSQLIIELDGYRDHSQPDRFEADRARMRSRSNSSSTRCGSPGAAQTEAGDARPPAPRDPRRPGSGRARR